MAVLYERYDCMKALAMIRTKMIVSVVQSVGIFLLLKGKKSVVSVVSPLSHGFLVLKDVLKTVDAPAS